MATAPGEFSENDVLKKALAAPKWDGLRGIKLGQVRSSIPEAAYRRSYARAFAWLGLDAAIYAAAVVGVLLAPSWPMAIAASIAAGIATSMLFIWGHDAAHGALFKSKRVSEVLGTAAMFPSLNIYRLWSYGHNKVHHGFTSLSTVDWIWRPLTPQQYGELGAVGRLAYRLERSPWGCPLHYLRKVWWPAMVMFVAPKASKRRYFRTGKQISLAYFVGLSAVSLYADGVVGFLLAVVVPFVIFNYVMAFITYLHHTHPDLPFFEEREEWSATAGQLYCSTVVRYGKIVEAITHNIAVHAPHHVDTRVPFYSLKQAYEGMKKTYGEYICEYRFTWSTARRIFSSCQLYDFGAHRWHTFASVRKGPATSL